MRDTKFEQNVQGFIDLDTYDWASAFNEANRAINHARPFDAYERLPSRIERGMVQEAYHFNEGENDGDPWILVGKALCPVKRTRFVKIAEGYHDGDTWVAPKMEHEEYEDFDNPEEFYFSLSAWCDYTGWDCQAGGRFQVGKTLRGVLVYGLSDRERELLGIDLADIDRLPKVVAW